MLGDYPCGRELTAFTGNVKGLNERAKSYVQTLVDALDAIKEHKGIFRWSTDRNGLQDKKDYAGSLTQMANDFEKINEQLDGFVAAKEEIVGLTTKVDSLETDLDKAQKDLTSTQDQLAKANNRIKYYVDKYNEDSGTIDPGVIVELEKNIEGHVLTVDNEFNYVILDLGINKVKDNTELLVARGDKLIAKVRVAKVLSKISVADILPTAMRGTVMPDDRVIMSAIPQ